MAPGEPTPELVADLYPEEHRALLEVLGGLSRDEWDRLTVCPGWSVKDIAAHILGDDVTTLSMGRDGEGGGRIEGSFAEIVAELNRRNEAWVDACRRASPALLIELLEGTGRGVAAHFASLDPFAPGPEVSWAGRGPHPTWLHIARDLTERWLHQAQIRDAAEWPPLDDPRLLGPVLRTFARALPVAYEAVDAPEGTSVGVTITGPAGSAWSVWRRAGRWVLLRGAGGDVEARVTLD